MATVSFTPTGTPTVCYQSSSGSGITNTYQIVSYDIPVSDLITETGGTNMQMNDYNAIQTIKFQWQAAQANTLMKFAMASACGSNSTDITCNIKYGGKRWYASNSTGSTSCTDSWVEDGYVNTVMWPTNDCDTGATDDITDKWYYSKLQPAAPVPLSVSLKEMIEERQAPAILHASAWNRIPTKPPTDIREERARQILRMVVGEEQFRCFLTKGFVTVRGQSGRYFYQVKPGHTNVNVFENGKCVESLCVQLNGNFPPTDSLVSRVLMLWNDEDELWAVANKRGPRTIWKATTPLEMPDMRPLPVILADLRKRTGLREIFKPQFAVA